MTGEFQTSWVCWSQSWFCCLWVVCCWIDWLYGASVSPSVKWRWWQWFLCWIFFFLILGCTVFLAVQGLFSSCSNQGLRSSCSVHAFHCGGFPCCRSQALSARASVVVVYGFSCPVACGIFLDQGSNPCPLHSRQTLLIFKIIFIYFIYLALPDISCGMQDLLSLLQHLGSLIEAWGQWDGWGVHHSLPRVWI